LFFTPDVKRFRNEFNIQPLQESRGSFWWPWPGGAACPVFLPAALAPAGRVFGAESLKLAAGGSQRRGNFCC